MPVASIVLGEAGVTHLSTTVVVSLVFQGVVVAFASYLTWFWLLTRYLAARLAVFSFLSPMFGVTFGVLILGERLSSSFVIAALLVANGIALDTQHAQAVDARCVEQPQQFVDAGKRFAVDADDEVAIFKPCNVSRTVLLHFGNADSTRLLDRKRALQTTWQRHGRAAHSDPRASHPAVREQLAHHPPRGINAGCKTDRLRAWNDRGVDADHLRRRVDQRPPRVARIERRVGLDHIVHQAPGLCAQAAPQRGDHACCHRVLKSERVADRNRDLSNAQRTRRSKHHGGEIVCADTNHSEIRVGIVADQLRIELPAIRERHADLAGPAYDV